MRFLHQLLLDRLEWYDGILRQQAAAFGYGHIPLSVVRLVRHLRRDGTSRIGLLAEKLGVTSRRAGQIVAAAIDDGILETVGDPDDGRVKLVRLSEKGLLMVDGAVASMMRIDAEIARHIGQANVDSLCHLLELPWAPAFADERAVQTQESIEQ
jgi:DNA-binding MarR family transcriptional regulator